MALKKFLLSSEIARLVLGYLREYDKDIFCQFLKLSPYLYDDREAHSHGEDLCPRLKYEGLSLKEILQEYARALHIAGTKVCNVFENEIFASKGKLPEKLSTIVDFCVQHDKCPSSRLSTEKEIQCELAGDVNNEFLVTDDYCKRCQQQNEEEIVQKEGRNDKDVNAESLATGVCYDSVNAGFPPREKPTERAGDLNSSLSSSVPDVPDTPGAGLVFPAALPTPSKPDSKNLLMEVGNAASKKSNVAPEPHNRRNPVTKSQNLVNSRMVQTCKASLANSLPLRIIHLTPGGTYGDGISVINISVTPEHSRSPKLDLASGLSNAPITAPIPVAAGVPVLPEVTAYPLSSAPMRRKTQSTPRRKAYIRTLEFVTPQKEVDLNKCTTSHKRDTHPGSYTPNHTNLKTFKSVKTNQKTVTFGRLEKLNSQEDNSARVIHQSEKAVPSDTLRLKKVDITRCLEAQNEKKIRRSTHRGTYSRCEDSPATLNATIACRTTNRTKVNDFRDPITTVMGPSQSSFLLEKKQCDQVTSTISEELASITSSSNIRNVSSVLSNAGNNMSEVWETHLQQSFIDTERKVKSPRTVQRRRTKVRPKKLTQPQKVMNCTAIATRSKTVIMSPSEKHARSIPEWNTYTISHASSSAFESSSSEDLVQKKRVKSDFPEKTPGKIEVSVSANEDTPITRLLRENVDSMSVDLSMILTPIFPLTPSINCIQEPITPIHETRRTDYSSGSSYYKPDLTSPMTCLKDVVGMKTVTELDVSEEHLQDVSTVSGRNFVLTPEGKETPTKQNKITDYYKKNAKASETRQALASSPESSHKTISESNLINKKTTLINPSIVNTKKDPVSNAETETETAFLSPKGAANSSTSRMISVMKVKCKPNKGTVKDRKILSPKLQTEESVERKSCNYNSYDELITNILSEGRNILRRRKVSGKNMSFLKLQMIAQCDTKLSRNIPISALCNVAEPNFCDSHVNSSQPDNFCHAINKEAHFNKPAVCTEVCMTQSPTLDQYGEGKKNETDILSAIHEEVENVTSEIRENVSVICKMWKKKNGTEEATIKTGESAVAEELTLTTPKSMKAAGTANVSEEIEIKRLETINKLRNHSSNLKRPRRPIRSAAKKMKLSPRIISEILSRKSPRKVEVLSVPLVCSTPKSDSSKASLSVSDAENSLKPESPIKCPPSWTHNDCLQPDTSQSEKFLRSPNHIEKRIEQLESLLPSNFLMDAHKEKAANVPTEGKLPQGEKTGHSNMYQDSPESDPIQRNQKKTPKKRSLSSSPKCKEDLPTFVDDGEFPELPLLTKKKLFGIKCILELKEVRQYLENEDYSSVEIRLNSFMRSLYETLFKWLQNPRNDEVTSTKVKDRINVYLKEFRKIRDGMSKNKSGENKIDTETASVSEKSTLRGKVPTHLPLNKSSSTQKILKQINVDSYLSHLHGQDSN